MKTNEGFQLWFADDHSPDGVVYASEQEARDAAQQFPDGDTAQVVPANWDDQN